MGDKKERDLDEIILFGERFEEYCQNMRDYTRVMSSDASSAENVLKDDISKQNINGIYDFCNKINSIVDKGEEPVLELVKKAQRMKDELEKLRRVR